MDKRKSRGGKSQRGEVKKWEDQRRERVGSKKMQVREKVGKSRFTVFFKWFVAPEGRKVGSLKRGVWSHVVRWEMKICTPLWRKALKKVKFGPLLEVEMSKKCTPLWCEALLEVKKVKFGTLLEVEMSKKCTPLWCEALLEVQNQKHLTFGPLLEVKMLKKCTPLWRGARVQVKMQKPPHVRTTFGSWDVAKVHAVVAWSTFPSQKSKV